MTSLPKTEVLVEALPYISQFEGKTFVIKYGGAAMIDEELKETFAQDVTFLKKTGIKVVLVHGGGKEVTELSEKLGLSTTFVRGYRYTDRETMKVAQMVLTGKTNKNIVARINRHGGEAVGLSGIDANLLRVTKYVEDGIDLGYVGEVVEVNTSFLDFLLNNNMLPVIAPIGVNEGCEAYNINADVAAASIAAALRAEKLVYLSDVAGLMLDGHLIHTILQSEADRFIDQGIITNGMIPKIRSASKALDVGVAKVHLIDGRVKHALLLEIFTNEGMGTELIRSSHNTPP
ncbi:MAG: acetylglutamate kinase [Acidobacteriota bacterium]